MNLLLFLYHTIPKVMNTAATTRTARITRPATIPAIVVGGRLLTAGMRKKDTLSTTITDTLLRLNITDSIL